MRDTSVKEAITNTTPKSCVDVICDCNTIWSLAQQFSTKRLSVETGVNKGKLVKDYAVRARRIAGTYARFYLETEEGFDEEKLGRYYWMALGAFASKTVACTFDAWQVRAMSLVTKTVWEGLGKGNFWLFCDISGWHWYHNVHRPSFNKCLNERNAKNYVRHVKTDMAKLPWQAAALSTINNFAPSPEIKQAFEYLREFEENPDKKEKEDLQLKHLLEVAKHEQGVILQPLIYDDTDFSAWIKLQRARYIKEASPPLEIIFTHQCSHKSIEVKSVAPVNTQLENFASRMDWINAAALKIHQLMREKKSFMHSALSIMSQWYDMPDVDEKGNATTTRHREV
jgi:hypothetical protein